MTDPIQAEIARIQAALERMEARLDAVESDLAALRARQVAVAVEGFVAGMDHQATPTEAAVPWSCVAIHIGQPDGLPGGLLNTKTRAAEFVDYPWVESNCVCIDTRTGKKMTYGQMQWAAQSQVDRERAARTVAAVEAPLVVLGQGTSRTEVRL